MDRKNLKSNYNYNTLKVVLEKVQVQLYLLTLLAQKYKVLLIDMDDQGISITSYYFNELENRAKYINF
ncbi:hypothetical protein bpSLO_000994 (plasmid) [Borrelia parkeri]|uniref:hypothetical protein n=1 Tax=Borrelia parkeri TaxID=141 RepID=UPI001FF146CA|nr:hypothetical protein [Borrelia parkeri]UPA11189.1 hypothetical protein bpSLO_000994 [Borrelia parkeri]